MRNIITSVFAFAVSAALYAQDLTILHLNDTHSHVEAERSGEHIGRGGVIEQAAYVDSVRCADGKGNVILLHAGDFSQGSSYFKELGGDVEIEVINAMKFDAICLGNHEFDNGLEELARRLGNLDVPVVCANYDFAGTPLEGLVKPYVTMYKANRKIGVIGLLTDVATVVEVSVASQLRYMDPVEVTDRYAKLLKEQGCEYIICLTHLGYDGAPDTDRELAARIRNVDLIVGGHSHTFLDDVKSVRNPEGKEVRIVTDGKWGLNVGHLSVSFQKNRLTDLYKGLNGLEAFSSDASWFPYPSYEDRNGWETLLGAQAEYIVKAGEKYLDYIWKNVPATAYLAYERTGERGVMETPLKENRIALNSLMLAELAEGKGRFMDQLIDGSWHIAHMPSWVLSAHLPRQRSGRALPDPLEQFIDLGSGALGAQMAVLWHFFHEEFDRTDPVIARVVYDAVTKQILDPYLNPDEQHPNWWLAYDMASSIINNWNPWCNADVILCFLLLEKDMDRLDRALLQSAKSVDKFLAYVKSDGACEEGPAYWGHAAGKLYDYLQIMHDASAGRFSIFGDPQIKDMGEYVSRAFVQDGWVVNFADASARLSFTPSLIYNYGKAVNSSEMQDFAIYNLAKPEQREFVAPCPVLWTDIYRALESLKYIVEMRARVEQLNSRIKSGWSFDECRDVLRASVPDFTWYPQTQLCYMKNASGWFLATKGGHNNEGHNHNDIGTFLLYVDGVPMFVDAGVGTYTKKTFGKDRYTIWSMCSDWHNIPVINGVTQKNGKIFRASSVMASDKGGMKRFTVDIAGSYPQESGCSSWIREYRLGKSSLSITDTYSLNSREASDIVNFMVHGQVYFAGDRTPDGYSVRQGEVVVSNGGVSLLLSYPKWMNPSVEVVHLDDPRLTNVWGNELRRISLETADDAPVKGKYQFNITPLK